MKTLFARIIKPEEAKKLDEACTHTINLLRDNLKLEKWECYFVVKTLLESFPLEDLTDKVEYNPKSNWK